MRRGGEWVCRRLLGAVQEGRERLQFPIFAPRFSPFPLDKQGQVSCGPLIGTCATAHVTRADGGGRGCGRAQRVRAPGHSLFCATAIGQSAVEQCFVVAYKLAVLWLELVPLLTWPELMAVVADADMRKVCAHPSIPVLRHCNWAVSCFTVFSGGQQTELALPWLELAPLPPLLMWPQLTQCVRTPGHFFFCGSAAVAQCLKVANKQNTVEVCVCVCLFVCLKSLSSVANNEFYLAPQIVRIRFTHEAEMFALHSFQPDCNCSCSLLG